MSANKIVRSIVITLLALVMALNTTAVVVPTVAQSVANSTATLAMENGTTAS